MRHLSRADFAYNAANAYTVGMAILNIRNLPDEVHALLRVRAARAGRSMEAEAREIITAACTATKPKKSAAVLQDLIEELYGEDKPEGVVDALIEERRREASQE